MQGDALRYVIRECYTIAPCVIKSALNDRSWIIRYSSTDERCMQGDALRYVIRECYTIAPCVIKSALNARSWMTRYSSPV